MRTSVQGECYPYDHPKGVSTGCLGMSAKCTQKTIYIYTYGYWVQYTLQDVWDVLHVHGLGVSLSWIVLYEDYVPEV